MNRLQIVHAIKLTLLSLSFTQQVVVCADMIMKSMQGGNNKQDLVIYLRGVRHCDLLDLVKFIYFGTVSVAKEDLNSFLALAKDLGVKGLDKHWSPSEGAPGEQMVVDEDWFRSGHTIVIFCYHSFLHPSLEQFLFSFDLSCKFLVLISDP